MPSIQGLRMRNLFPANSRNTEPDNSIQDILDAIQSQQSPRSGMQEVASAGRIIGSNPGAEMNARAARDVRDIYESYKRPAEQARQMGPSNDAIDLENYFDRKNAEIKANATMEAAGSKGWKTVTTVDPNDPSKQISVQVKDGTGEVRPLDIPGTIVRPGSAKDIQTGIDAKNLKASQRETVKAKAQESLDSISELMDKNNQLTPEAARAVGKSSIGNFIPTTLGYSGSAKIKKLASQRILEVIAEMKAQSKTGATGFGALNMKELGVLEKAASMLDTGLDEDTFRDQLKKIKDRLLLTLQDEPDSDIKPVSSHSSTQAPVAPEGYEYVRRPDNKGWTAKKLGSK